MSRIDEQNIKRTLTGTSFNSLFMQPKIAFKGTITATTTVTTITHNLGYIPYVRIWATQLSGEITVPVLVSGYTAYHSRYAGVPNALFYVTSTTLVIYTDIGSCTVRYRIYKV